MVDTKRQAVFLVLFALCTLMASKVAFGHFSLGREVGGKQAVRQGPINPLRNLDREAYLRKNQQWTGIVKLKRFWGQFLVWGGEGIGQGAGTRE